MLGDALAQELAETIRKTTVHAELEPGDEPPGDTTHLSVTDTLGNVVALTQSVQSLFGAKVAHPKLGFFYNNYLVTCPRYHHPSQLAGGCMPRSNVTPALVVPRDAGDGHAPVLAIGAAGSRRIISATLQVLCGVIDRGLGIDAAMNAPRVHALLNGNVWVESDALSEGLRARLERRYRRIKVKKPLSYAMGAVQAVQRLADGSARAAADPRRDGTASTLGADGASPGEDTAPRGGL